jgi:nucleoprotein TPR
LQEQLDQVTGEKDKFREEVIQLQESIAANNSIIEQLNVSKTSLENEIKTLQTSLETQRNDVESANAERDTLKADIEKLKENLVEIVGQLNAEKSELEQRISTLSEETEKLQKSADEFGKEKAAVQEEFDRYKASQQELNSALEDAKAAKVKLEQDLQSLKEKEGEFSSKDNEDKAKLEADLSLAREEIKNLNTQLEVTRLQLTSMENDLVTSTVTHEGELQTTKETLGAQIDTLQKEIQALQRQSLNTSGGQLKIGALRGSADNIPDQSVKLREELQSSNKLLEETKKQYTEQVAQLTNDLQTVRDELTALKSTPPVEVAPNNSAELQSELDELKERLNHATIRHDEFVKATKEERERFDGEVKKLSALVTEERKRVEIK